MHYYLQGLGYDLVSKKNLPDYFNMLQVPLLDLFIYRIEDNVWVQKNYKSGKIRIIIATKDVLEPPILEKECENFDIEKIKATFDRVPLILQKQKEIEKLFNDDV